jgi:TetR/AcrR family transcriptional regulator, cholesterol catabolism regulator
MGRRNKSSERRGQILKAAASLFIRRGYINTSVRDIATKCNVNVATLYHYIGSKEKILSLFQEYTTAQLTTLLEQNRETINSLDAVEALVYVINKYVKWVDEYQDVTVFWYQESKNLSPQQMKNLTAQEEYSVEVFAELLDRGVRQGVFTTPNTLLTAHNIVVMCDMWAFRRWLLKKHFTFEEYSEDQVKLILAQLKVKNS